MLVINDFYNDEIKLFFIAFIKRIVSFVLFLIIGYLFIHLSKKLLKNSTIIDSNNQLVILFKKLLGILVLEQKWFSYDYKGYYSGSKEIHIDDDRPLNQVSKASLIIKFFYCFFGLQISYVLWGLLQERIMTKPYKLYEDVSSLTLNGTPHSKPTEIYYHDSEFLVFYNRLISVIIATLYILVLKIINRNKRTIKNCKLPPFYMHSFSSMSNAWSSWFQYEALKFISFPIQVLVKALKMVPVILISSIVWRKKQSKQQYLIAFIVSIGSFIFIFNSDVRGRHDSNNSSDKQEPINVLMGVSILIGYLIADGFTGTWQSELFNNYKSLRPIDAMLSTGIFTLLMSIFNIVCSSDCLDRVKESMDFLIMRQHFGLHIFLTSLLSAIGQIFIFKTINEFGAIVFTAIMISRQLISILLSNYVYGHSVNFLSSIGIAIAFSALTYDVIHKIRNYRQK